MRIWITGVGLLTALGRDATSSFHGICKGRRGFREVTLFDTAGCRTTVAGELADFTVDEVAGPGGGAGWSRTDAMAVAAARQALAACPEELPVDLVVGGTTAGMLETEDLLLTLHRDGRAPRDSTAGMLSHPLSATMDRLVAAVRPFGKGRAICSACSSGANALVLAAAWLRTGRSERVLAGGADGLCRVTFTGFNSLGALSPEPCLPFDARRDGLTLGEGAAFLLVETEAAARARGAEPIVELRGWAVASEAHHITNPEPAGTTAAEVMRRALAMGGLAPEDVDYVNAHGTATKLNDAMEAAAIRRCFGDRLPLVSSTKGAIGHTLGAAGAVEAVVAALAIARGVAPPTAGLEQVDEACQLPHLREARELPIRAALSNSFGFGGSDAAILLTQVDRHPELEVSPPRRVFVAATATVGPLGLSDATGALEYLAEGPPPDEEDHLDRALKAHLDAGRARRMDRASRLAALAMGELGELAGEAGAIVGSAFGSVDACAAYLARIEERGARMASPAVFPNLLPSSPVAHASIYHRMRGPALAIADLQASAEAALTAAADLIAAGEADTMIGGAVEPQSAIARAVLAPLFFDRLVEPRSEGAAMLRFVADAALAPSTNGKMVEVVGWWTWRGRRVLTEPAPPGSSAAVFVARDDEAVNLALAGGPWARVPREALVPRVGSHEAVGAFAAAAAVGAIVAGRYDEVLVLGTSTGGGAALHFAACGAVP